MEEIFLPTMEAMKAEGRPFKGVIYFGLMLTADGPKVVEYNARFGDPETQAVLYQLDTDLFDIFNACVDGTLADLDIQWKDGAACCLVLASGGYPLSYEKGRSPAWIRWKARRCSTRVPSSARTALISPTAVACWVSPLPAPLWRRRWSALTLPPSPSCGRICISARTSARFG